MDMPDRFSRNGARTVVFAGVTLFVVILGLLAVQMASGKDPALGARKPAKTNRVAAAPQPVQPPQPSYAEPGYNDGYSTDDGYTDDGSQDGYAVPQQDTQQQDVQPQQSQPQQQSQAPLQSSTS